MTWGKFIAITLGILLVIYLVLFFGYGQFVMEPDGVDDIDAYKMLYLGMGGLSVLGGFMSSAIWFNIGNEFDGRGDVSTKYWLLFVLSIVISLGATVYLVLQGAGGVAPGYAFTALAGVIIYYLSSLLASADAVKYIPPGR